MKIAIGCDDVALELKKSLKEHLNKKGYEVIDVGVKDKETTLYANIAEKLCKEITNGRCERGLLICGTGIGMAITANKIPGIRAAVAHDMFSLERMIMSNDCQVLCMGARIIALESAKMLIDRWLEIKFIDGPSTPKVKKIMQIESNYRNHV